MTGLTPWDLRKIYAEYLSVPQAELNKYAARYREKPLNTPLRWKKRLAWHGYRRRRLRFEWRLYWGRTLLLRVWPYDEPPDCVGWWAIRFEDVPDGVDTYPGDCEFTTFDGAKTYADQWAFHAGFGWR